MAFVSSPLSVSFQQWGNQLYFDFPQYKIPIVPHVENWRKWANMLLMDNLLDGKVPLPTEQNYPLDEDWRRWAQTFLSSLNN